MQCIATGVKSGVIFQSSGWLGVINVVSKRKPAIHLALTTDGGFQPNYGLTKALARVLGSKPPVSPNDDCKPPLRLGISIERIQPSHPQQNGRHERMHLTLKKEATKPPGYNFLQQQERFNQFIEVYNNQRPHQTLNGRYPAEVYTPLTREFHYPDVPTARSLRKTLSTTPRT